MLLSAVLSTLIALLSNMHWILKEWFLTNFFSHISLNFCKRFGITRAARIVFIVIAKVTIQCRAYKGSLSMTLGAVNVKTGCAIWQELGALWANAYKTFGCWVDFEGGWLTWLGFPLLLEEFGSGKSPRSWPQFSNRSCWFWKRKALFCQMYIRYVLYNCRASGSAPWSYSTENTDTVLIEYWSTLRGLIVQMVHYGWPYLLYLKISLESTVDFLT